METVLTQFWDFIKKDLSCELYFVKPEEGKYKTIQPKIDGCLIKENLKSKCVDYLGNAKNKEKKIVGYNNEYDSKDEIMSIKKKRIDTSQQVIDSLGNVTHHEFKENFSIKDIKFYVLKLETGEDEKAYLFKKYRQSTLLIHENFLKLFPDSNGKLVETDKHMIILDTNMDVILYKDVFFILNRTSFEQIFNYKDEYIKQRDEVLDNVKKSHEIFFSTESSFDNFIKYCKDARYQKKFKAITDNEGVKVLEENITRLPELNEKFAFEFELDSNNKIICEKKEALADILDLLSGKLVFWALNNEPREATVTKKRGTA